MSYQPVNISRYAIRYGLAIAAACIAYFLIMRLFNLHFEVELSLLNAVIISVGIFLALKSYRAAKNGMINYLDGLGLGFVTAGVTAIVLSVFVVVYGLVIDANFIESTTANEYFGDNVSKMALFGYVALEALGSGGLATFVFMQYFKRPDHKLSN